MNVPPSSKVLGKNLTDFILFLAESFTSLFFSLLFIKYCIVHYSSFAMKKNLGQKHIYEVGTFKGKHEGSGAIPSN